MVSTFRRTIDVDDLRMTCADHTSEFLATGSDIACGQLEVVEHHHSQRGGEPAASTLMVYNKLIDLLQILPDVAGHDMQTTANGQDGIGILYVCHKRESTV